MVRALQGRTRTMLFPILLATTAALAGDASITHDTTAGTWAIAAGGTTLTLALDSTRDFTVDRIVTASGSQWSSPMADSTVTVGGRKLAFGSRAAGFSLREVTVNADGARLHLNATFELAASGLRITRHYAVVSGSPTFEAWNTYE